MSSNEYNSVCNIRYTHVSIISLYQMIWYIFGVSFYRIYFVSTPGVWTLFVHLSSFKLRMCLQCVMIPGIKSPYQHDMLLVLFELELGSHRIGWFMAFLRRRHWYVMQMYVNISIPLGSHLNVKCGKTVNVNPCSSSVQDWDTGG